MFFNPRIRRARRGEQGYILMILLLTVALMMIAAAIIVPSISFDIKRDREEEMIHRGVQYSRAIRAYYKKFNRYPVKIEDLENTNQMRFLRKRYKDPLTGKDFRLLHFGEAKLMTNGMSGGVIPGASTVGPNGSLTSATGLSSSPFGGPGTLGNSSPFGQTAQTPNSQAPSIADATQAGTDGTQPGTQPGDGSAAGTSNGTSNTPGNSTGNSSDKLGNATFGGAPIVGVASLSKDATIREFDHKRKYSEWQFVYDPTMDRGFLITTPYQPSLMMNGMNGMQNINGQPGQNGAGANTSGFGNGFGNSNSGFGNSFGNSPSGMQNSPTSPNNGFGNSSPNQPQNPPQQQ